MIEYGVSGDIIIRFPYTPYSMCLRGTIALVRFSAFVAGAGGCSGNRVDAAVVD